MLRSPSPSKARSQTEGGWAKRCRNTRTSFRMHAAASTSPASAVSSRDHQLSCPSHQSHFIWLSHMVSYSCSVASYAGIKRKKKPDIHSWYDYIRHRPRSAFRELPPSCIIRMWRFHMACGLTILRFSLFSIRKYRPSAGRLPC